MALLMPAFSAAIWPESAEGQSSLDPDADPIAREAADVGEQGNATDSPPAASRPDRLPDVGDVSGEEAPADAELDRSEGTPSESSPVGQNTPIEPERAGWDIQSGFGSEAWLRRDRSATHEPPSGESTPIEEEPRPDLIVSGRLGLGVSYDFLPGFGASFGAAVGLGLFQVIDLEIFASLSATSEEVQDDLGARFSYVEIGGRVCRRFLYGVVEPALCVGAAFASVDMDALTLGDVEGSRGVFVGHALARVGVRPAERVAIELEAGAGLQAPADEFVLLESGRSIAVHQPSRVFPMFGLAARVEFN